MQLHEVTTAGDRQEFLLLPVRLYKNTPDWIRPLDKDIEGVFDPDKILKDDQGKTIGRVAAFKDTKTMNKGNEQPTGGMGFFECIEDKDAAFVLFDACKAWAIAHGLEAMDGPINFGSREKWWGLLIEGYDLPPNYQCQYNFPYYKEFFEAYGFQVYFYQLTFGRPVEGGIDEKLKVKANLIARDPNYSFSYLPKKDWGTLPEKIRYVYNKAWAKRGEIPELTESQAKLLVKQMKPILDEKLIWFGYYKDEPIAFFLSLPEVNEIFRFVNGKMDLIGKLKFLYHKFRKTNKKAFGILFGVTPEHHGKGVDGAIIETFRIMAQAKGFTYSHYEMNWIGDFNPKMIRVVEQINAPIVKRHATYRKLFDESKPFKRMPFIK